MIQGPYRTTQNRDNIRRDDPWNKFPEGEMFDAVRAALLNERLLPKHGGGHIAAARSRLGRTKGLRELFDPKQVAKLLSGDVDGWFSDEITPVRTQELYRYLTGELRVPEITPGYLVERLNSEFLETQTDECILKLYEFLNVFTSTGPPKNWRETVPLVRLVGGSHVRAREDSKAGAFLTRDIETDFPTVRPAVCETDEARKFLRSLGIAEPHRVDDVIWNVLPTYQSDEDDESRYSSDIERILEAYDTASRPKREKLVSALRDTRFVMVRGGGDGHRARPGEIYLTTDRLKKLFFPAFRTS